MLRFGGFALALCVCSLCTRAKGEEFYHYVYRVMKRDFHRNNLWPDTFTGLDRRAVAAPCDIMVNNGYRMQNTLGPYHFDEGTNELNEAGRLKIASILTEEPEQYRTLFVERDAAAEITSARIASVKDAAAKLALDGPSPEVLAVAVPARGTPADQLNGVFTRWSASMPNPQLPKATIGASSTSGSSK